MTTSIPRPFHAVVGYDFSPRADAALREAALIAARASAAELHLMTVVDAREAGAPPPRAMTERLVEKVAAALRDAGASDNVHVYCHVQAGDPAGEILTLAEDVGADLIVVGTHGRRGVARVVIGSVAERVVREASCQVLVARPRHEPRTMRLRPEPPCEACVAVRASSAGSTSWCEAHARPWVPPHRYAYHGGALHPFHADGMGPDGFDRGTSQM